MNEVTRIDTPDATDEPEVYRDTLLAILGERDPLAVMAETRQRLQELVAGRDQAELARRPTAGEWSPAEIVGHMVDVEVVFGFRWRLALTADRPSYPGYDEKLWSQLPKPPGDQLLAAFDALRTYNLWLLRSIPRSDWERVGVHGEQGPETVDVMARKIAAHDLVHLNQIARAGGP
jgi:hypothetical protein